MNRITNGEQLRHLELGDLQTTREKFVHEVHRANGSSYGESCDIYSLPIGTKFRVWNGLWDGEIVERNGEKYMYIIETKHFVKLQKDKDYNLVVSIK